MMRESSPLPGRMQHQELTVDRFLDFAARWHGGVEVVGRRIDGVAERSTYRQVFERAKRLSAALLEAGIAPGDRVATMAMNHIGHLEAWYAISGIGAVCHTVNPRLFKEQLVYILTHAGDRLLMADAGFRDLVAELVPQCPAIERVVLFSDGTQEVSPAGAPPSSGAPPSVAPPSGAPPSSAPLHSARSYEDFLESAPAADAVWGAFDERSACGLCYTSGTTGLPKGALYSHRSNYLHALMSLLHDVTNFSATDVVLPLVPMFHANAWGIPFAAPAVGASLVLPGARLDGASVHRLIVEEGVTFCGGVPTLFQGLIQHLAKTGGTVPSLKRILVGGSACPESVIRTFADDHGVEVVHAWGMTETSPIASAASPTRFVASQPAAYRRAQSLKQGRPIFGIDLSLVDDHGADVGHDGVTPGRLLVRGATVVRGYFNDREDALDAQGWFDTGDIATIDALGYVQITDRAKDLIKSGGEWISSIEIENIAMDHPKSARAAVVAIPHERWGERPLLIVELLPGEAATAGEYLSHLVGRIASWWMPDEVRFVDHIPLGPTGKIDKKRIRAELLTRRSV
jgi:fatty-acyl-CoA synthase